MLNSYGTRLPRSHELHRLAEPTRALLLYAHRNALNAERAGLEVGFTWNKSATIEKALRSVDDRFHTLTARADEFGIDLYPEDEAHEFNVSRNEYAPDCSSL